MRQKSKRVEGLADQPPIIYFASPRLSNEKKMEVAKWLPSVLDLQKA